MHRFTKIGSLVIIVAICLVQTQPLVAGGTSAPITALYQNHTVYVGQMVTTGTHAGQFQPCGSSTFVVLAVPRSIKPLTLDKCPSGMTLAALKAGLRSMELGALTSEIKAKGMGPSGAVQSPFSESDMQAASGFAACDPSTVTKNPQIIAADELKNREQAPAPTDINSAITLDALFAPGDDSDRFTSDQGAVIEGYVKAVKAGGKETVNCKVTDPEHVDTHIELTAGPDDTRLPLIIEVTPRLRYLAGLQGVDWSTTTLKDPVSGIAHHWVRVTGWMFFDAIHADNSENINPGGSKNWRQTVWEIHPITNLEILSGPPQ